MYASVVGMGWPRMLGSSGFPLPQEFDFLLCLTMMVRGPANSPLSLPPLPTGPARHHLRHVLPASEEQEQVPRARGKGNGGEAAGPARQQ